jgi:hypothetical protein
MAHESFTATATSRRSFLKAGVAAPLGAGLQAGAPSTPSNVVHVGDRRQLFLDHQWFDPHSAVELVMQTPRLEEVLLVRDRPWEGLGLDTPCLVKDGGRFRLWYRADEGSRAKDHEDVSWICYAESDDCVHWKKPNLGLFEHGGSRNNNIVYPPDGFAGMHAKNPSVVIDPGAKPDERYKMIARTWGGSRTDLVGFLSPDGLKWRPVETNPLLTEGPFDSHNIVIRDEEAQRFIAYIRGVDPSSKGTFKGGVRAVRRSESRDFRRWSKPEIVLARDQDDPLDLHFYTNAAVKYPRAAHAYLMFPMVLYSTRKYPTAPFDGLSDVVFAVSRNGIVWRRPFRRPFLSPGLDERNWVDRNPMMGVGVVETSPTEISMIAQELLRTDQSRYRRVVLRTDGFVSVRGPYAGWGEFTTPPLRFSGSELELNYRTSAGGSIYVELQDAARRPLPGFALSDSAEIFGDKIAGTVGWRSGKRPGSVADRPVRVRVRMRDAEIFAFRFA